MFFKKLFEGLDKTRKSITDKIDGVFKAFIKVDEELLEELEEILITSDIGYATTTKIIQNLRKKIKDTNTTNPEGVKVLLKEVMIEILSSQDSTLNIETKPSVIMVVGVNGVGKTTSIGKLSNIISKKNKKVLVAAADTFRAAAIDQLEIWTKRAGVDIIKHQEGADPAAVVYDAVQATKSRNIDVLICDTAGRLHTKKNLMDELAKINRVCDREIPSATRETLLVLDATTGQNGINQAKNFKDAVNVNGIILTKLDGTAKGGVVLSIVEELKIPIKLIGVGEQIDDLQEFDAKEFVDALLE